MCVGIGFFQNYKKDLQNNYKINKDNVKIFLIFSIIVIILFGKLYKMEYATDTYQVFNFSEQEVYNQFASSGRFVSAIVFKFAKKIGMKEQTIYAISFVLAILCMILSLVKMYKIIKIDINSKVLKILIPILIVPNFFSIELFLFIEKGIMIFGILMCIIGIENVIKFWKTSNKKYLFFSLISMFIANCSYQGVVGIFASVLLVYILKYSKTIKEFIKNNLIIGTIYSIPAIIDYLLVKFLYKQNRLNGKIELIESIKMLSINFLKMLKNMYGLMPKYVFILVILFTFSILCCKICNVDKKRIHILKFIYIFMGISVFAVAPQILQPTSNIWLVPRSTYCFASIYGILILYLSINYTLENIDEKLIILISIFLLIFQVHGFCLIEKDRYILNQKDYEVTMQIIDKINKYESKTKNIISKIEVYQDSSSKYTYDGLFAVGDMNVKCYANNWSIVAILNYYLNRDLKLDDNQDLSDNFKNKEWNKFDDSQIVFCNNTMALCKY